MTSAPDNLPASGGGRALVAGWALPVTVAAIAVGIGAAPDWLADRLVYDRGALAGGALWRALTGHLVHLGWAHLWLDVAGLVVVWLLVGEALSGRAGPAVFLALALVMSALMAWLSPDLQRYVGLSGVLHGLLVAGAMPLLRRRPVLAIALLLAVAAKVAKEQILGPSATTESLISGGVFVDAHLYGALSGGAVGGVLLWRRAASG